MAIWLPKMQIIMMKSPPHIYTSIRIRIIYEYSQIHFVMEYNNNNNNIVHFININSFCDVAAGSMDHTYCHCHCQDQQTIISCRKPSSNYPLFYLHFGFMERGSKELNLPASALFWLKLLYVYIFIYIFEQMLIGHDACI